MKTVWQLQDAKSRLSELVNRAQRNGAQTITRHGRPIAVVLSAESYARLQPRRKIVDVLRDCPEPGFAVERLSDKPRQLKL
ncbi:MAG: type II toxin-antitoxin system Phd/YefM family antitoxin [Chthoniobacterales bacterium]|nr:type II toxin-antitoxin system Phd/YefM family antitoxin [Chthoniobacterales bacterium]